MARFGFSNNKTFLPLIYQQSIFIPLLCLVFTDLANARFQQLSDIELGSEQCSIADITVASKNRLLINNISKESVQLYNSKTGELMTEIQLNGVAENICMYGSEKAAVGMRKKKKVQLIEIKEDTLTLDRELDVNKDVLGITSSDDRLVVSYSSEPWLEVISPEEEGKVECMLDNTEAAQYFKFPNYLTSSKSGYIYVSDSGTDTIIKLNRKLQVLQTFTGTQLHTPYGIALVGRDQLIVCNGGTRNFVLLRLDTGDMSIILENHNIIPYHISFCHERKCIYLASGVTTSINVFEMD